MPFQPFDITPYMLDFSMLGNLPETMRKARQQQITNQNLPESLLQANRLRKEQANKLELENDPAKKAEWINKLLAEFEGNGGQGLSQGMTQNAMGQRGNVPQGTMGQGGSPDMRTQLFRKALGLDAYTPEEKSRLAINQATQLESNKLDTKELHDIEADIPHYNATIKQMEQAEKLMQDPNVQRAFGAGWNKLNDLLMSDRKYGALKTIFMSDFLPEQAQKMSSKPMAVSFKAALDAKPGFKTNLQNSWGQLQQFKRDLQEAHRQNMIRRMKLQGNLGMRQQANIPKGSMVFNPMTGGFDSAK